MVYLNHRKRAHNESTTSEGSTDNKRRVENQAKPRKVISFLINNVIVHQGDPEPSPMLHDESTELFETTPLRYFYMGLVAAGGYSFNAMALPFLDHFLERCHTSHLSLRCTSAVRWVLENDALDSFVLPIDQLAFRGQQDLQLAYFFGWLTLGTIQSGIILFQSTSDTLHATNTLFASFGFDVQLRHNQLQIPIDPNTALLKQGLALLANQNIPLDTQAMHLKTYLTSSLPTNHLPLCHFYDEKTFSAFVGDDSTLHRLVARDFYDQPLISVNAMLGLAGLSPLVSTRDFDITKFIVTVKTSARAKQQTDKMKRLNDYLRCSVEKQERVKYSSDVKNANEEKIVCTFDGCDKLFKQSSVMMEHVQVVHENKKFACRVKGCHKVFEHKRSLFLHTKVLHKKKVTCQVKTRSAKPVDENQMFECPFEGCDASFAKKHQMNYHAQLVHRNQQFICPSEGCEKVFGSQRGLASHVNNNHVNGQFVCSFPECDKVFPDRLARGKHRNLAHKNQKIPCPKDGCTKAFDYYCHLDKHLYRNHENQRFHCTVEGCSKSFALTTLLERHLRAAHHDQKYVCPFKGCYQVFAEKDEMSYHYKKDHETSKTSSQRRCSECGKKFSEQNLTRHLHRVHHKFACMDCPKVFSEIYQLHRHIQEDHVNQKEHSGHAKKIPCTYKGCTKRLVRSAMRVHVEVTHLKLSRVGCTVEGCEATFAHKYYMKAHQQIIHKL